MGLTLKLRGFRPRVIPSQARILSLFAPEDPALGGSIVTFRCRLATFMQWINELSKCMRDYDTDYESGREKEYSYPETKG